MDSLRKRGIFVDKKRREIIVNEIEYWEKNRLLPEHYCQYLLTLYTEGAGKDKFKKTIKPPKPLVLAIIIFIFALANSLLLHVFSISFELKIGISIAIYLILAGIVFYIRKESIWYVLYLVLFNIGMFFSLILFSSDLDYTPVVMIWVSVGFIIFLFLQGMFFKLRSLKVASFVCLLGIIGGYTYYLIQ